MLSMSYEIYRVASDYKQCRITDFTQKEAEIQTFTIHIHVKTETLI